MTPKNLYFRGLGLTKLSSYSFDRIVLIFVYIVERTNTKILSSHFLLIGHSEISRLKQIDNKVSDTDKHGINSYIINSQFQL